MPTEHEYRLAVTAQDEASQVLKKISGEVGGLNKFVREGQRENRQMNYLFRESAQSVRALSSTFVGANGLVGAMGKGFDTMQGVDFALSGLNATLGNSKNKFASLLGAIMPYSLAIGAAVGGFIMLKDEFEKTAKAADVAEKALFDLKVSMGLAPKETIFAKMYEDAKKLREEADKITEGGFFSWASGTGSSPAIEALVNALPFVQTWRKNETRESAANAEAKDLQAQQLEERARQRQSTQGLWNELVGAGKVGRGDAFTPTQDWRRERPTAISEMRERRPEKAQKEALDAISEAFGMDMNSPIVKAALENEEKILDERKKSEKEYAQERMYMTGLFSMGMMSAVDEIHNGFMEMFTSIFGEANSVVEKLFVGLVDVLVRELEAIFVAKVAGSIIDAIIPFHSGGLVQKAHGGLLVGGRLQSDEVPIIAQTGERVLSRSQTRAYDRGASVVVNINAPIDSTVWVKKAVEDGLRRTGLSVDKFLVNHSTRTAIAR